MSDAIDYLEERDDVEKTEYTRVGPKGWSKVTTEMWHDASGLQKIFQIVVDGHISPKGLQEKAKEHALVVRETKVDSITQLKAVHHNDDGEYTYKVTDSE